MADMDIILINRKPTYLILSPKLKLGPGRNRFSIDEYQKIKNNANAWRALEYFKGLGYVQEINVEQKPPLDGELNPPEGIKPPQPDPIGDVGLTRVPGDELEPLSVDFPEGFKAKPRRVKKPKVSEE